MLTPKQQEILLRPINPSRIAQRKGGGGKALSYLEAWDVKAHLIRVFGFGGFSAEVLSADLMFEEKVGNNWNVGYKVLLRLRIESLYCTYTEAAVGIASLPSRGEAHDMAVKTAESDALKRAAVYLGDQYGLSLYNNGSTKAVVVATLAEHRHEDIIEVPVTEPVPHDGAQNPGEGDGEHDALIAELHHALVIAYGISDNAERIAACTAIQSQARTAGLLDATMPSGVTVASAIDRAMIGDSK